MTFEITRDMELVKSIIAGAWEAVTDDFSGNVDDYFPPDSPMVTYVLCKDPPMAWKGLDDFEVIAMWMLVQHSPVMVEVHTCILPSCGYYRGRRAALEMARWIWDSTTYQRIITQVPEWNRAAGMLATAAGMKLYGRNVMAHQHGGELHDILLMGMSRPNAKAIEVAA